MQIINQLAVVRLTLCFRWGILKMPRILYTERQRDFLKDVYKTHVCSEIPDLYFKEFGVKITASQVKAFMANNKLKCGVPRSEFLKGKFRIMSQDEKAWLEEHYPKLSSRAELLDAFNKKFNRSLKPNQLKSFLKNHNILSGRTGQFEKGGTPWNKGRYYNPGGRALETQFKKGNVPWGIAKSGDERRRNDGIYIKISDNNWVLKNRKVWEDAHGPIPEGHCVIFKDNDMYNCELENLALISRSEHLTLNRTGLSSAGPEFKDTAITAVKLINKVNERKRGGKPKRSKSSKA